MHCHCKQSRCARWVQVDRGHVSVSSGPADGTHFCQNVYAHNPYAHSQQKIPTQSLQAWISSLSTLVLCERGWVTGLNGNPRSQCACARGGACVLVRGRFGVCNRQITFPADLYQWASDDDDELKKVRSFSAICRSAKPNICAEVSAEFVVL